MSNRCQTVVFSNRAYNAIIRESFAKDPVETGGILLGYIRDDGVWIVMEVLPPGIDCINEIAYFEYDDAFVNYLAPSVANQYKINLKLLGLWHRHPGSMNTFSRTDDGTNRTFALQNPDGAISGLVNIDPNFRLTMYYLGNPREEECQSMRPNYQQIEVMVGDDIIPEECFLLKYYNGEDSDMNPRIESIRNNAHEEHDYYEEKNNDSKNNSKKSLIKKDVKNITKIIKSNKLLFLFTILIFLFVAFSAFDYCRTGIYIAFNKYNSNEDAITLNKGEERTFNIDEIINSKDIKWESSNKEIIDIDDKGKVVAKDCGPTKIKLYIRGKCIGDKKIEVYSGKEHNNSKKDKSNDDNKINKDLFKIFKDKVKELTLNEESYTIELNTAFSIEIDSVKFDLGNDSIVNITKERKLVPKSIGSTNIIASYGDQKDTLVLIIKEK